MIDRPEPNTIRRSRQPNSRPTIGFLLHNIGDAYGFSLWSGGLAAAKAYDANLICFVGKHLESPHGFAAQGNVIYRLVNPENVDGLVLSSATLGLFSSAQTLQQLADKYHPLPRVSLGLPLKDIPSLIVENYQGMREIVVHLIKVHGYRRIAFISGPQNNPEAAARYQAYADALTEYDLPLDQTLVSPPTEWDEVTGKGAVVTLLDKRGLQPGNDFEALVGSNDEVAFGALAELQSRGIHVPDDVAVTGFDGVEKSEYCIPPLTTVRQPVYEQAYLAVEMLVAQSQGEEMPHQKKLPTELVVRRSCGCPDSMVVQAAVGPVAQPVKKTAANEPFPTALETYREQILADMIKAAGTSFEGIDPVWAEHLLEAFSGDVAGKTSSTFGAVLEKAMRQTMMMNRDVKVWHSVLSSHRRQVLPYLSDKEHIRRAEDMWQQARVLIAGATYRLRAYQEAQANERAEILRSIGQTMITTFDLANSVEALTIGLPELGFPGCYLTLYDFPEKPESWSNLVFAYNENGRIDIPRGGLRFPSLQLIPQNLLPSHKQLCAVVEPLYFREQQLGFVIFEAGLQDGTIYESLRGQISSMLQGVLLMQQVQRHTAQLDTIVTETLATSEEMQVTIAETSRQAQAVANAAQQSVDVSKTGQNAVANTVAGMETIQRQVEDIAQSILALSERTQQIGEIIGAVEDIADQSRLLALNASIEAARAGDEGLGFAVVAREMRHLAGQSREATTRVSDILNEIQRAANTAVMVTEEGSKGAQQGMELASRAGEAIHDLTAIIEESARVAIQIAASTHQQTNAMDQLVVAMKSIKQASTQTSTSIKEAGL